MEKSKVYFANFRATVHENIQQKLTRLMKTAGMDTIDFQKKYVAIKIHFGEPGNLAYLRPNYAKTVVDFTKYLPSFSSITWLPLLSLIYSFGKY